MNIRPIISTPKTVAFAGAESTRVTTKQETIKPLSTKVEEATLKKLSTLSARQVTDTEATSGWQSLLFRISKRNRIRRVDWATDSSGRVEVTYPNKFEAGILDSINIEKSRRVVAKPEIITHLNRLMEIFLKKRGRV